MARSFDYILDHRQLTHYCIKRLPEQLWCRLLVRKKSVDKLCGHHFLSRFHSWMCAQNYRHGLVWTPESLSEGCMELYRLPHCHSYYHLSYAPDRRDIQILENCAHFETSEVYELDREHAPLITNILCVASRNIQRLPIHDIYVHNFRHCWRQSFRWQAISILSHHRESPTWWDLAYKWRSKLAVQLWRDVLWKPQQSRARLSC